MRPSRATLDLLRQLLNEELTPVIAKRIQGTYVKESESQAYVLTNGRTNSKALQTSLDRTWNNTSFEVPKGSMYCKETAATTEQTNALQITVGFVNNSNSEGRVRKYDRVNGHERTFQAKDHCA